MNEEELAYLRLAEVLATGAETYDLDGFAPEHRLQLATTLDRRNVHFAFDRDGSLVVARRHVRRVEGILDELYGPEDEQPPRAAPQEPTRPEPAVAVATLCTTSDSAEAAEIIAALGQAGIEHWLRTEPALAFGGTLGPGTEHVLVPASDIQRALSVLYDLYES